MEKKTSEDVFDLTPEILVIGPGGNKGYLFLGSLLYLKENLFLDFIHTYVGCSVGSILSLLIMINVNFDKIIEISFDTELVGDVSFQRLVLNGGISNSSHILMKIQIILFEKYNKNPTFKELYEETGKELCIVAYNLTKHETEYFTYKNTPDVKCLDAIKLSINMPIIYEKVIYNDCVYIDGAMGNPYPINFYDDGKKVTLGLYIDSISKDENYNDPISYFHNIIVSPIKINRSMIIENCSNKCINIGFFYESKQLDLNMKYEEKRKMFNFGYNYTKLILDSLYV